MNKKYLQTLVLIVLAVYGLISNFRPALAQEIDNVDFNQGIVTFSQLGSEDFTLTGPIDSDDIVFGMPASWVLKSGAELEIYMDVSFNDRTATGSLDPNSWTGGAVTITLNNIVLGIFYLKDIGPTSIIVPIPLEALQSRRDDGLMELEFDLTTDLQCDLDQITNVIFHSYSKITIPHDNAVPNVDLKNFPRPLFSDSFIQDTALIVVPDAPTPIELQAALTTGAGLGNLAGADFLMELVPVSNLNASMLRENHIIFIGKPSSFSSYLDQINFQSLVENGQYKISGAETDDGVIQMLPSSWSLSHVILMVSGNSDVGVLKSAQAISTGTIRSGPYNNVSVVKSIQTTVSPTVIPTDFTLADLGYSTEVIESQSTATLLYEFNVPPGKIVGPDAYFELVYGHSGLLNFDRSGVVVLLNDQPIGSVKLSDVSAAQALNNAKINIPSSLVQVGLNRIEVVLDLVPYDVCISRNINSEWFTVWSESGLHLPLGEPVLGVRNSIFDLSLYPSPFVNDPSMRSTAFVVPQNDPTSWQGALNIASYLGNRANGSITLLKVFYADQIIETDLPLYNFIIIGMPDKLPIIEMINSELPAPFDSNNIAVENNMPAKFLTPPDTPIGYVELLRSPWNENNLILAALGSNTQGLEWSFATLGDSPLGSQLIGNFAVVVDQKITTADTRISPLSVSSLEIPIEVPDVPGPVSTVDAPMISPPSDEAGSNSSWIPIVLIFLAILLVITLVIVGYTTWIRNRTRHGRKSPEN